MEKHACEACQTKNKEIQRLEKKHGKFCMTILNRDVKLANELEARAKVLEDLYFEEWNSCHYPDLHTTWETLKNVAGC
jgi:hypothetical protein